MAGKKKAAPTRRRNYGQNHGYFVDETKALGVTTLIGRGMPKPALQHWAARLVAESAVRKLDIWQAMSEREAIDFLRNQVYQSSGAKAARGTAIHKWAEQIAKGETVEVPEEHQDHVDAFLEWWNEWDAEIVASELVVVNRAAGYAGTADLVCDLHGWHEDGSPGRILIDIATSGSGVYPEKALQVCAYANAESYLPLPDGSEPELPLADLEIEGGAILWLQAQGAELYPVDIGGAAFRDFRYVVEVARICGDKDDPGRAQGYLHEAVDPYPFTREDTAE